MRSSRYSNMQQTTVGFAALSLIICTVATIGGYSETQVSFCDLVKNPQLYSGKEVTVRATHRVGYEWSELYCLDCLDKGRAWLDFTDDLDRESEKALRRTRDGGIFNLTVEGTFESGSTYGHLNGYRYRFVAHKVRNVAVISKGIKPIEEERKAEKLYACGGSNPK